MQEVSQTLIFSDLDGCLLNKTDYDWSDAEPVLRQLAQLGVPVVLNSSKTVAEMEQIHRTLNLPPAPFVAENGGALRWTEPLAAGGPLTVLQGPPRVFVLSVLDELKSAFSFQSFADLGVAGVMQATDLPEEQAQLACDRHSTEPLLWQDSEPRLAAFRDQLVNRGLTLTRGGRFWHVAGDTTKGTAMLTVADRYRTLRAAPVVTVAIGDSPIDQSMLDMADYAIGIPDPGGQLHVSLPENRGLRAAHPGAQGWAMAVAQVLQLPRRD